MRIVAETRIRLIRRSATLFLARRSSSSIPLELQCLHSLPSSLRQRIDFEASNRRTFRRIEKIAVVPPRKEKVPHRDRIIMSSPDLSPSSSQDALKPLLEAVESSKDANIMTIRSIVLKIFSEPNVFAGYDQVKSILVASLEKGGPEGAKIAKTLDLFSYGVYGDYVADASPFLPLTDSQIFKLRQLTAMSIVQKFAFQKTRIIPYQEFQQGLALADGRQVEEVLISCIYAGIMGAKLCQKSNALKLDPIKVVQTRDVPPPQVTQMVEQLQKMRAALAASLQTQQNGQDAVSNEREYYQAFWKQTEERKKAKAEGPRGWDETLTGDISAAVRRQKRSRGVSGGVDNTFGRFHL